MSQQGTRKFGLLGKTLGHSFSRSHFMEKFEKEEIDALFENIELPDANAVEEWMKSAPSEYTGVSVTIPYKEVVIPFLDELSPEAKAIGAVNCIHFKDGKSIGHNTDAYGFGQSIKPFLRNIHERALLLGTGGASKAVAYTLKNLGITVGHISRTPNPEQMIYGYAQANEMMVTSFLMSVNCTLRLCTPTFDQTANLPTAFSAAGHSALALI